MTQPQTGWQPDKSYIPCPECNWTPRVVRNPPPGVPISRVGTTHHGDCSLVPHLSAEEERDLREKLAEMDRVLRRGAAEAMFHVIG